MRILDLFSGAGGAGAGYRRAGFEVVGVDIDPQPNYPYEFHQGDALKYLLEHHQEFDAFHASPPCQAFTNAQKIRGNEHPDYVTATRAAFDLIGKPWVIENVPGAPLILPIELCGCMFPGLKTYRPRLFELNWELGSWINQPEHRAAHRAHHEDGQAAAPWRVHARGRELLRRGAGPGGDGHRLDDPG
uniref:DNA methyltransferase n=1 Tax=Mycobacterium phage TwoPeat TaxID=3158882 RepID=A0AAU8GRC0_9CAUD